MKKLLSVLLVLLAGCGAAEKPQTAAKQLTVLCPKGAPAIGMLGYLKDQAGQVTTVDGADALTAAFTEADSEYDIIVAPVNLGAALVKKQATDYRLAGILTWGNLYIVSNQADQLADGLAAAAFGQNAVPDKILAAILADRGISLNITWFNSVADVASALLSGKFSTGLLAEPALSMVMGKDASFKIIDDVEADYKNAEGQDTYPQAAIFVKKDAYEADKTAYEAVFAAVSGYDGSDLTALKSDLDAVGAEVIGVPSAAIGPDTYRRMAIRFAYAGDSAAAITAFLKVFGLGEVPDLILEK